MPYQDYPQNGGPCGLPEVAEHALAPAGGEGGVVGGAASALGIDIATVINPDSIATVASAITIPFERLFIINYLPL